MYLIIRLVRKIKVSLFKAIYYKCLKNCTLYGVQTIINPKNVHIRKDTRVNDKVFIHGDGVVIIGKNVTLSYGAAIISTGYDLTNWKKNKLDKHHIAQSININDNVWIGANATILSGVYIAEGIVVAA